jgi:hypothetical protein
VSDPTAYRASDTLAAAYRAYLADYNTARLAAVAYDNEHPAHPLYAWQSNVDRHVEILGFRDVDPHSEPPVGLSRRQGRPYLVPKRGIPGDPWRAVITQYDRFPDPGTLLNTHEVPSYVHDLERHRVFVPGIHDFGEHGVFVTILGRAFDDPGPHLTRAPLSTYYAAKEAHQVVGTSIQ